MLTTSPAAGFSLQTILSGAAPKPRLSPCAWRVALVIKLVHYAGGKAYLIAVGAVPAAAVVTSFL
jgi:hypothetical protein